MQALRRVSEMRQRVFVESQRKSKEHQGILETKSKSQSKQTFLLLDQVNLKEQVVSSFLPANIPLHKLNHHFLKPLFATMGKDFGDCSPGMCCLISISKRTNSKIISRQKFF